MIATNDLIYLVTNVFYAYILCKFMRAFFGQKGKNQKAEILSFVAYYCVISVIYVGFHNSIVTLWSNLMLYFLLTFNYESSFKLRLANVIFIYALLFSSETIALLLLKLLGFGHFSEFNGMEYVTAQIFIGVIYYVLILIFSNYKLQKNSDYPIPLSYWIAIVAVPVGMLFPTTVIATSLSKPNALAMLVNEIIILGLNLLIFHLYEHLLILHMELMEKKLLEQQNTAYQKQLEIVTNSQQKFKIFRHDMRHHLSMLAELIKREEYTETLHYLENVGDYLSMHQERFNTGNTVVDSIINYMAGVAEMSGIRLSCEIEIPEKVQIAAFDLNGIVSNLLDNAIKVVQLLPMEYEKTIYLTIRYTRGLLFIAIENPYNVAAQRTAKEQGHGLGLKSVQMAVEKYGGSLKFNNQQQLFRVEIILYEEQM